MENSEFYRRYANTPLKDRSRIINAGILGNFTLAEIYAQVHMLDDYVRPINMQIKNLIDIAEKDLK